MKAQLSLFNKGLTHTLDKDVLKERIQNTHFRATNSSFTIKKWVTGDEHLLMLYRIEKTTLGELLIAATAKGVTYLGFITKSHSATLADLKKRFPESTITEGINENLIIAIQRINNPEKELLLNLHLKGTQFQLSVWKKLILIPFGGLTNYKQLGDGEPDSRAIGAAVGANPVSYLVPCHRVIRADGNYNGFYWGNKVKAQLLTYEATNAVN